MLVSGVGSALFGGLGRAVKDLAVGIWDGIRLGIKVGFSPLTREHWNNVGEQFKEHGRTGNIFAFPTMAIAGFGSALIGGLGRIIKDLAVGVYDGLAGGVLGGLSVEVAQAADEQGSYLTRLKNHWSGKNLASFVTMGIFGSLSYVLTAPFRGIVDGVRYGAQLGYAPVDGPWGAAKDQIKQHWQRGNVLAIPFMLVSGVVSALFGGLGRVVKDLAVGMWDGMRLGIKVGFAPLTSEHWNNVGEQFKEHGRKGNIFAFPMMVMAGLGSALVGGLGRIIKDLG